MKKKKKYNIFHEKIYITEQNNNVIKKIKQK